MSVWESEYTFGSHAKLWTVVKFLLWYKIVLGIQVSDSYKIGSCKNLCKVHIFMCWYTFSLL